MKWKVLVNWRFPCNYLMWFVYTLQCIDGSYYTGSTNNIDQRVKDHLNGKGGRYTRSHKPQKLVYTEELPGKSEALKREAQIKKWTRAKKDALIKPFPPRIINFGNGAL